MAAFFIIQRKGNKSELQFCWPNEEAAMWGIVASPSCTAYHWGTLIALYWAVHQAQLMAEGLIQGNVIWLRIFCSQ